MRTIAVRFWPSSRLARSAMSSQVILPEQSSTRSTWSASTVSSPMIGRHVPDVKSSGCDAAALLRSIDFGVKTMSGRCSLSRLCLRRRWKYDAGVDGCATVIESSAH